MASLEVTAYSFLELASSGMGWVSRVSRESQSRTQRMILSEELIGMALTTQNSD